MNAASGKGGAGKGAQPLSSPQHTLIRSAIALGMNHSVESKGCGGPNLPVSSPVSISFRSASISHSSSS